MIHVQGSSSGSEDHNLKFPDLPLEKLRVRPEESRSRADESSEEEIPGFHSVTLGSNNDPLNRLPSRSLLDSSESSYRRFSLLADESSAESTFDIDSFRSEKRSGRVEDKAISDREVSNFLLGESEDNSLDSGFLLDTKGSLRPGRRVPEESSSLLFGGDDLSVLDEPRHDLLEELHRGLSESHTVTDRTNLLKDFLTTAKSTENVTTKEYKQACTDLKTKGAGAVILGLVSVVALVAGIALLATPAWPAGLIFLGGGIGGMVGAGWLAKAAQKQLPKDKIHQAEQNIAKIEKIEALMKAHPKKEIPDGTSFEEFVRNFFPPNTTTYNLDLLSECASLFEQKASLDKHEKEIRTLANDLETNIVEVTKNDILFGKLSRVERKLEKLTEKKDTLFEELKAEVTDALSGEVDIDSLEDLNALKADAIEAKRNRNERLNEQLEANKINIIDKGKELHKINLEIDEIKNKIEKLKKSKDDIKGEYNLTKEDRIGRKEQDLRRLEAEKTAIENQQKDLNKKKTDLLDQIEKNDTFFQKFEALNKIHANINALQKRKVDLQLNYNPYIEDFSRITKTKTLKEENDEMKARIVLLDNELVNDNTEDLHTLLMEGDYDSPQPLIDDYQEINEAYTTRIREYREKIAANQRELDGMKNISSPYISAEIEKLESENKKLNDFIGELETGVAKNNFILAKAKRHDLNEKVQRNEAEISRIAPEVVKEKEIRSKLLHPHGAELENLSDKVDNFIKKHGCHNDEEIEAKIQRLQREDILLQGDPEMMSNPEMAAKHLENASIIVELEANRNFFDNSKKEYERLCDKLSPSRDEFNAEMHALENKISHPTAPRVGEVQEDLRAGSPTLKKWQNAPIIPNTQIIDVDKKNINVFGTYNNEPIDRSHPGTLLRLSGKWAQENGFTNKNNFLSNAYAKELVIPGDERSPYSTVTHYLAYKRIEKSREEANSQTPPDFKTLMSLEGLEASISRCPTAKDVQYFFDLHMQYFDIPLGGGMFHDLDNDLKKALYFKFVGPDGKPNEEGRKLLDTGDVQLYAGREIGDPSYGMEFYREPSNREIKMKGENKLGVALMELRETLRKQEKKAHERDFLNRPEEEHPLDFDIRSRD
jgi:hypothetical protein